MKGTCSGSHVKKPGLHLGQGLLEPGLIPIAAAHHSLLARESHPLSGLFSRVYTGSDAGQGGIARAPSSPSWMCGEWPYDRATLPIEATGVRGRRSVHRPLSLSRKVFCLFCTDIDTEALPQVCPFPGRCSHFFFTFPPLPFPHGPPATPHSGATPGPQPNPNPAAPPSHRLLVHSSGGPASLVTSPCKPAVPFHPPRTCLVHPALPLVLEDPTPIPCPLALSGSSHH